jgi:hypothetical protein
MCAKSETGALQIQRRQRHSHQNLLLWDVNLGFALGSQFKASAIGNAFAQVPPTTATQNLWVFLYPTSAMPSLQQS